MIRKILVVSLLSVAVLVATITAVQETLHTIHKRQAATTDRKLICTYDSRNDDRVGASKMSASQVNPRLCTHLSYFFAELDLEQGLHPRGGNKDNEQDKYSLFNSLKRYNKNLKTILFVDSPTTKEISDVLLNEASRRALIKLMIQHLRRNNFDGVDLRFIFVTPFEKNGPSYTYQFIKELREEIESEAVASKKTKLSFTMTFPFIDDHIDAGLDVKKLAQYLDWFHVYTIGYHNASDGFVSHQAPLYSSPGYADALDQHLTIDYTISNLLNRGLEPKKIMLAFTTNGKTYTLFSPDITDLGSRASGPGGRVEFKELGNAWSPFHEICDKIRGQNGWTVVQTNKSALGPYAYKGDQWVSFDDEDIVRMKTKYAIDRQLGGIVMSYLDQDDFAGKCYNKPFPLTEAAKEVLSTYKIGMQPTPGPSLYPRNRPSNTGVSLFVKCSPFYMNCFLNFAYHLFRFRLGGSSNGGSGGGIDPSEVYFPTSKPNRGSTPGSTQTKPSRSERVCLVPEETDDRSFWATCEEASNPYRSIIHSGGSVGQGCLLQIKCKPGYSFYNTNISAAVCSGSSWFPSLSLCYSTETWQAITKAQIPQLPQQNGMAPVAYPVIINNIYPPPKCDCDCSGTTSRRKTRSIMEDPLLS